MGGVVYALLLGLLWAYNPAGLEGEEWSVAGLVVGALFVGFLVMSSLELYPTAAPILLGIGLVGGVGALAVGAILRAAG